MIIDNENSLIKIDAVGPVSCDMCKKKDTLFGDYIAITIKGCSFGAGECINLCSNCAKKLAYELFEDVIMLEKEMSEIDGILIERKRISKKLKK